MRQSSKHKRFAVLLALPLVVLLGVLSLMVGALAQSSGGSFQITSHVAASGADPSTNGAFSVTGTTGETAAGPVMGAPFITLQGGFWPTTLGLTPPPVPASLQFESVSANATEGCAAAQITVTRTGGTTSFVTVDYATSDGTAQQRADYVVATGTLAFAPGETSKTISVLTTEDAYVEGAETLTISLSNPQGGSLGSPNTVTLQILDNDSVNPPTAQPIDDVGTFVCQHYHDFLSRQADAGGAAFWTGEITVCGGNQTCINNKRVDVSNAFFFELEFQQTGAYVYRLYRAAFGNNQPSPNPDGSNPTEAHKLPSYSVFVADRARVIGGSSLAQSQLDLANAFVQRPEFLARYPGGLDGPGFVDAILNTIRNDSGADLTSQRTALIDLFNSGGRGAVLYRLADDNVSTNPINNRSFIDAEYNRAFVATQYFGYLRRDSDIGGFLFWLSQVDSGPLRDVAKQHAMVCSFITSAEYQQRFSSVVTHSNAECPR
jgi:hypothetical protein